MNVKLIVESDETIFTQKITGFLDNVNQIIYSNYQIDPSNGDYTFFIIYK